MRTCALQPDQVPGDAHIEHKNGKAGWRREGRRRAFVEYLS